MKVIIRQNLTTFGLLLGLTFLVYGSTLQGQFLTADDIPGIVNNLKLRNFQQTFFSWELLPTYYSSLLLFFGNNPMIFHLVSIFLHTLNAILVFILAYQMTDKKIALLTAVLFTLHPINTEAVSWISATPFLITGLFTLGTLNGYLLFKKTNNYLHLLLFLGIYLIALFWLKSPSIFICPILICLLEWIWFKTPVISRKSSLVSIPLAFLSTIFLIMYLQGYYTSRSSSLMTNYSLQDEKITPVLNRIPYTITTTLKTLIWPKDLSIYQEGELIRQTEYTGMVLISVILLIITLVLIIKKSKYSIFPLILFFINLPSYSPQVIAWFFAERYVYIGSIFFCLLISLLYEKNSKQSNYKKVLQVTLGILLILYTLRSFTRSMDFKDNKSLWEATQKTNPNSPRVYNNLGDVYSTEGNYVKALQSFEKAIELNPNYAEAQHNAGYTYMLRQDFDRAIPYLEKSLEINPNLYPAHQKLTWIYAQLNKTDKALDHLKKLQRIAPEDPITLQLEKELGNE